MLPPKIRKNDYHLSSVYDPESILSDLNTNHILNLDSENGEKYKIALNFSSNFPYPVWVNGNSMKIASTDEFFKPDWRNVVTKTDRRWKETDLGFGYKKNKTRLSVFPILMKLGNVAKLIINSYRKKLSNLVRITRRYQPASRKQLLILMALFVSFTVVSFL